LNVADALIREITQQHVSRHDTLSRHW
jgi:hypothetical protein